MKKLKNNHGITLMALSLYIIALLLILGIMTSMREFFFKNMDTVKASARFSVAFDKFNSSFIKDIKENRHARVSNDNNNVIITFEDGTTYVYNSADNGIYRGKIKIAGGISAFTANEKTIIINSVKKEIISINMVIGKSDNSLFNKTLNYTLRYW